MRKATVQNAQKPLEADDRFTLFRRVDAARVSKVLLVALDNVFVASALKEANKATRQWFAARPETERTADLADDTLAYYERALRHFRPYYELDYKCEGEERTARYHGLEPFLRWAGRQSRLIPESVRVLYAVPSLRVQVFLRDHPFGSRSYIYGEGTNPVQLETIITELAGVFQTRTGGRGAFARWPLPVAGLLALAFAVGLALRFHALPLTPLVLGSTLIDIGLVFALVSLFRRGWPFIQFDLGPTTSRWRGRLFRACSYALASVVSLGAAWAFLTTFFKITW